MHLIKAFEVPLHSNLCLPTALFSLDNYCVDKLSAQFSGSSWEETEIKEHISKYFRQSFSINFHCL